MRMKLGSVPLMLALAGCVAPQMNGTASGRVPDEVFNMAAQWQNLATVRLLPEDGCYWYEHAGPVETTLLPLRTPDGRPICNAVPG